MKSFQAIQEERGEKAFKQAIAMGLKYGGFGYWKDPQSGETKFKTENDTLIPVEPQESSELAGKGGPDSNGMADGQMGGGMMGGGGMGNMMGPGGMLQMPGQMPGSGILGAPEPGEETPEGGERKGWEPGPDGDTCAGPDAQDPADVPKDTYVGTTNYAKWVAGPDGDNMTTVSAATIQERSYEKFMSVMITEATEAEMAQYPQGGYHVFGSDVDEQHGDFDIGMQTEKLLANRLLPMLFPEAEHEHRGGTNEKTDIRSTIGEDEIGTSVKYHGGFDDDWSTSRGFNTSTVHRPYRQSIDQHLGLDREQGRALHLFDDLGFKYGRASQQERNQLEGLLEYLNDPEVKRRLFDSSVRNFSGENPVEQLINMSADRGYNGKQETGRRLPDDNFGNDRIKGRISAHDVSDPEVERVLNQQEWNFDNNRGLYLGRDHDDATLYVKPPQGNRGTYQMHLGRRGVDSNFPLMWDGIMNFEHGLEMGQNHEDKDPGKASFAKSKHYINDDNPVVQRLKGRTNPPPQSAGNSPTPGPSGPAGRRPPGGGLSPEDLAQMNAQRPPAGFAQRRSNLDDQVGHSFESFLSEAPMAPPMGGTDPKAEAEQLGLEFAGFGWYRDPKTGRRVAKIVGNKLVQYSQDTGTAATTHTGNPTNPASGQTPATKARSMGLQSNGSGGYIDPSTGQVVAKTVNNELVFYDAQGGAISDGSGGEQLTQSAPSWVDPVSGLIIVPPAQPESPEEQAAVPDSTPAQAPMGLDAFFNKRKIELYRQQAGEDAANADIDAQQMEVDELMNMHPGMRELQRQMQGVTDRAMDSDDDDTNERGAMLMDMMNDEAGSYLKYFMMAKDEDKDEIVKEIKTLMIATARADQAQDKLREEQPENGSDRQSELLGGKSEAQGKIERMRDRLDTRHDSNLNIPDAEKLEAGEDYPETMVGDDITYNLNPMKRAPSQRWWEKEANYALRKAGADFRNPQTFVEVNWDVNDTEDKFDTQGNQKRMTGRERKRTALNAVSTWRNDVLPQLQPGMVLMANPLEDSDEKAMNRKDGRNQRERIYQLAGFGKTHDDIMGAVVIRDERGNNKLVPISPTREQQENERKIEENYIRLIRSDLNNLEVEVAYDMLFS